MDRKTGRRKFLTGIGTLGAGLLAGCVSEGVGKDLPLIGDSDPLAPGGPAGPVSYPEPPVPILDGPNVRLPIHREQIGGTPEDMETYVEGNGIESPQKILEPQFEQDRPTAPGAASTGVYYEGKWVGWVTGNTQYPPKIYLNEIDWEDFEFDLEQKQDGFNIRNVRPAIVLTTRSAASIIDWQPSFPIDEPCRKAWCRFITALENHEYEHIAINERFVDRLNREWAEVAAGNVAFVKGDSENIARQFALGEIKDAYKQLFEVIIGDARAVEVDKFHDRDGYDETKDRWGANWSPVKAACTPCKSRRYLQVKRWRLNVESILQRKWQRRTEGSRSYTDYTGEVETTYEAEFELVGSWNPKDVSEFHESVKWRSEGQASRGFASYRSTHTEDHVDLSGNADHCFKAVTETDGNEFYNPSGEDWTPPAQIHLGLKTGEYEFSVPGIQTEGTYVFGDCSGEGDTRDWSMTIQGIQKFDTVPDCGFGPIEGISTDTGPITTNDFRGNEKRIGQYTGATNWTLTPVEYFDHDVNLQCYATE